MPAGVSVRSSNDAVALFTLDGAQIVATTGLSGSAELIVLDRAGVELDRATVKVADVVRLESGAPAAVRVVDSDEYALHVQVLGAAGQPLLGVGAVRFTTSGALDGKRASDSDSLTFWGNGAGAGRVSARAGAAVLDLDVAVIAPEAVSAVEVRELSRTRLGSDGATLVYLDATLSSPTGALFGSACRWTFSGGTAALLSDDARQLSAGPGSVATVSLTSPGTVTATCTAGPATASILIAR